MIASKEIVTKLNSAKTEQEVMDIGKLNWSVEQSELMTTGGLEVPSHKALYRSDTRQVLAVVGHDYQALQNTDFTALLGTFVERFNATYEYLYCLNGGSKILAQAKLGTGFDIHTKRGDDHMDRFITLMERRGGGSVVAFFTTRRMWCSNQFNSAFNNAAECVSIRHSANTQERVRQAIKAMGMSEKWFEVFQSKAKYLSQKLVDKQKVESFLDTVIGLPITEERNENNELVTVEHPRVAAQRERVIELFEGGQGNHGENAWELFQGVTEMVDHHKHVDNADKRYTSAMIGSGNALKQAAFEAALAL